MKQRYQQINYEIYHEEEEDETTENIALVILPSDDESRCSEYK